jgi:hypothetical protein
MHMRDAIILAEGLRPNHPFENEPVITVTDKTVVVHETSADAARAIVASGFRTGRDLGVAEKRGAVYFADPSVNPGLYARNDDGDTYAGQEAGQVSVDIAGLRLLNLTYREDGRFVHHERYKSVVVRGDLSELPEGVDGAIAFLADGRIYEVALPADVANRLLS